MTAHDKSKWNHGHYFIVNLDLSSDSVVDMRNDFIKDKSLIRSSILREEPLFQRPCLKGEECLFGDLPVPDHEKQVYKVKHLKRLARYDNKKRNKNLDSDRYSSLPID
ncbi:hypothetical protein FSP39_011740 [Pinctada imbricata]|uniref:Uncharacterized protein n=1 Tax=Pinctada imbricata TaxID=66713 RepID=A0AA88Y478_PINIB|nr:hypothetical protein FSP39_011740 [Pinctada imbricata]